MASFSSFYITCRRPVGPDASDAERRQWLAEADTNRRWKEQYFQEKSCMDLPGIGLGKVLFTTTKVKALKTRFLTPFEGLGNLEVVAGLPQENFSSGHGCLRLIRTPEDYYTPRDVLLVPFQHIEQVIVIPATGLAGNGLRNMFRVMIVPTAGTGMTPWRLEYPELIYFGWPNKKADKGLKAAAGRGASEDVTYISVLKDVLDEQLLPFNKKVVMFIDGNHTGPEPLFSCVATTTRKLSASEFKMKGPVIFLPTGILWPVGLTLYLPFRSFSRIILTFHRDMDRDMAVVAMTMMISVSEPFYNDMFEEPQRGILQFKIDDWKRAVPPITRYASVHKILLFRTMRPWYSFARGIDGGENEPYLETDESDSDEVFVEVKRENEDERGERGERGERDEADGPVVKKEDQSDQDEAGQPEVKEERIADQDEAGGDDETSAPQAKSRGKKRRRVR